MIRMPDRSLPTDTAQTLATWQAELNAIADFDDRVTTAIERFRSRSSSQPLRAVRETLTQMCSGLVRCGYCEDSAGHEIEHIRPKVHYPDLTFVWHNLLLSCGPCNRFKNAKFAIMRGKELIELERSRGRPRKPPQPGQAAIIDPRCEDPMEFLAVDLVDTFLLVPREGLDDTSRQRTRYTIDLGRLHHRMVWEEMKRSPDLVPGLRRHFEVAPELREV